MRYDLTEKLALRSDPVLVIRDTELTVRSDAETVLRLMDAVREQGELEGARAAAELLFAPADRKKLAALGLSLEDWLCALRAAMELAMGLTPGAAEAPGE